MTNTTEQPNTGSIEPTNNIVFYAGATEEVLRLDKDGMTYKGQRIEDAGEAHRAFLEAMRTLLHLLIEREST